MRFVRSFLGDSRGAAAAEMALLLPVVLALIGVSLEGGYYMWSEHKVVKGVRDGARFAGRQFFDSLDCASGFTDAGIVTSIQQIARSGYADGDNPYVSGSDNPVVPGWTADEVTVTIACDSTVATGIYESLTDGAPHVVVSASVDYPSLFGSLFFTDASIKLNASAHAAVMGI